MLFQWCSNSFSHPAKKSVRPNLCGGWQCIHPFLRWSVARSWPCSLADVTPSELLLAGVVRWLLDAEARYLPKTESGEDTPTFAQISFLLLFCLFALPLFQNTFPFHFSHLISLFFSILTTIAICMITWSVWQLSPSFSFSSEKVPFWHDASCTPGVNSPALRSLCSLLCHYWYG